MNKFFIILISSIIWECLYSQCDIGEVEIWEVCYPIETTTILHNTDSTFGEFPIEICSLINLEILDLDVMWGNSNYITGEIPECIGDLVNLNYLDLGWNQLYGEIPESIGNLTDLTYFNILYNQFSGEIPETIGNLSNLTYLISY